MKLIDADKLPYVNKVILVDELDGDITITIAKEYTSYVNDETPTVEAIPIEWLKNELIPKAEKLGATEYANNIRFVLEDWEAWKRYHG